MGKGFRQEVGSHFVRGTVFKSNLLVVDEFANEMIANVDMLRSSVEHVRIVDELDCTLVVAAQEGRFRERDAGEFGHEVAKPDGFTR